MKLAQEWVTTNRCEYSWQSAEQPVTVRRQSSLFAFEMAHDNILDPSTNPLRTLCEEEP